MVESVRTVDAAPFAPVGGDGDGDGASNGRWRVVAPDVPALNQMRVVLAVAGVPVDSVAGNVLFAQTPSLTLLELLRSMGAQLAPS